ncbi:MAG TPA: sugar nucleotide-binding protein [Pirellulales bacterium]|nr:sugar nucleotide-binding protein [Pirellulales bacterium]
MSCRSEFTPVRLPLLITGIAGVPGYNALEYFRARYPGHVVGIRQRDNFRLVGEGVAACDAEDRDGLKRLFDEYAFRSVLDCAGNCALRACELDPPLAHRINVAGVENLLSVIGSADVRLVHLSVDLVFSGQGSGNHREEDETDPVTVYGATMVAAERVLAAHAPWACTLRISLPMGVSFNGHAGAIDWIQSRFKKSKPATLYFDEVRTPTYTDCLNELYETMLGNRLAGLFHAGAPRALSLFEVGQVINRVGGYPAEHLMGCLRAAAGPIPPRAGNVSMNCDKLRDALGYEPFHAWPYDDALVPTHRDWHRERPRGWPGSRAFLEEVLYRNPLRRRHDVA